VIPCPRNQRTESCWKDTWRNEVVSQSFPPYRKSIEVKLRFIASTAIQVNLMIGNIKRCEADFGVFFSEKARELKNVFHAKHRLDDSMRQTARFTFSKFLILLVESEGIFIN
jgi:hypothetical protein